MRLGARLCRKDLSDPHAAAVWDSPIAGECSRTVNVNGTAGARNSVCGDYDCQAVACVISCNFVDHLAEESDP